MPTPKKEKKSVYVVIGCLFRQKFEDNLLFSNSLEPIYEILLVKRREKKLPEIDNMWELPGGKVEENETEINAVEREFLEETGYSVKAISALDRVYAVQREYTDFIQDTYISCFRCELLSEIQAPTKYDSKIGEIRWFKTTEIDFFKTLVGSREFIVDIAKENDVKIEGPRTTTMVSFQVPNHNLKSSAKKRRGRKYILIIQFNPELSEHYYLITHNGSFKNRKRGIKINHFIDYESMTKKAKEIIQTRIWHGYIISKYDKDFPLIIWIKNMNYPIGDEEIPQLYLPNIE